MSKSNPKNPRSVAQRTYTVDEFCEAHGISRSTFYKLRKLGLGPRIIKAGRRTLISFEAAAEWRASREADSELSERPKQAQRRDAADLMGRVSHGQR